MFHINVCLKVKDPEDIAEIRELLGRCQELSRRRKAASASRSTRPRQKRTGSFSVNTGATARPGRPTRRGRPSTRSTPRWSCRGLNANPTSRPSWALRTNRPVDSEPPRGDEVDREAAEPVAALVVLAGNRSQAGLAMLERRLAKRRNPLVARRQPPEHPLQRPGA